jgi:hypothetical protein
MWQVALLGSATFDVRQVDPGSLRFGPKGAESAAASVEDFDSDGHADLVLRFGASESGAQPSQSSACLTGLRLDSIPFEGCGSLNPPGKR